MKKSVFFDFLHRRQNLDFDGFLAQSREGEDYINWNDFLLPQQYGLESELGAEAGFANMQKAGFKLVRRNAVPAPLLTWVNFPSYRLLKKAICCWLYSW